jgi:hypothetical protein
MSLFPYILYKTNTDCWLVWVIKLGINENNIYVSLGTCPGAYYTLTVVKILGASTASNKTKSIVKDDKVNVRSVVYKTCKAYHFFT